MNLQKSEEARTLSPTHKNLAVGRSQSGSPRRSAGAGESAMAQPRHGRSAFVVALTSQPGKFMSGRTAPGHYHSVRELDGLLEYLGKDREAREERTISIAEPMPIPTLFPPLSASPLSKF